MLGFIFLFSQTILVIWKPKIFFLLYLIYITSFFGFISNNIIIYETEIGLFYQNMLMLFGFLVLNSRLNKETQSIKILNYTILAFYLFGILYPIILGFSNLKQSIIASKEFSSIFLINYLFVHKEDISILFIEKIVNFLGYYFLIILSVFIVFKEIPPAYVKYPGQIQYNYPTLLSLFLFIQSAKASGFFSKLKVIILLGIWGLGMFYEGHMAITITTILGCLFLIFRIQANFNSLNLKRILSIIIIISTFFLILPIDSYLNKISNSASLQSRMKYNTKRMELIKSKPLFGYGFIHKSAMKLDETSKYSETLSYIDSGYTDLLGKFGIVGTTFFLITLMIPFIIKSAVTQEMSTQFFFFQLFAVNFTWSVFSFSMGLIPLSLALFMLYKYKDEEYLYMDCYVEEGCIKVQTI